MARKSYGNTIKYEKRTGYVQGNTVRKLQVAEPYSNDPTSIEQLEEERKRKREQQDELSLYSGSNGSGSCDVRTVLPVSEFTV